MRKTWVSSVVAGLLVLAPIAAVAQSGGDEVDRVDAAQEAEGSEEVLDEEVDTLELVAETETDDVDEGEDVSEEDDDGHGERVSTVARCAPTGKLDIEGFANHGAFVRAVAQGETITVEDAEYDLSTAAGVDALCTWADGYEPAGGDVFDGSSTDGDADGQGPPAHAGKPDHAGKKGHTGKPDHAGHASREGGNGNGKAKGNGKGR